MKIIRQRVVSLGNLEREIHAESLARAGRAGSSITMTTLHQKAQRDMCFVNKGPIYYRQAPPITLIVLMMCSTLDFRIGNLGGNT